MPAATTAEFKTWSGLTMDEARLQVFLDDAHRAVIRAGVPESHEDFNLLHRMKTVMILPGQYQSTFQRVNSRSISGMSVNYVSGGGGGVSLESEYTRLLESVIGREYWIQ